MRSLFFLLLISVAALAEPVKAPTLTDKEKGTLDSGGTVIHDVTPTDNAGIGAVSMGVIDAPTSEVWPVIRDCQHFATFMPRTKSSAMLDEDGRKLCHVELDMPFPLTNLWSDTSSVQREEPAGHYHRAWTLVRGTYKRNSGSWTLVPWGEDKKKTLVVYAIDSDPKMAIPDPILRSAQTGSLPQVFAAIRKRVIDLRK